VAGFNVEYSSINFALFFLGEYSSMLLLAAVSVILFVAGHSLVNIQFFFGLFLVTFLIKNNSYTHLYDFIATLIKKFENFIKIERKKEKFLGLYFPMTITSIHIISIIVFFFFLGIYLPLLISLSSDTTILNYILQIVAFFLVNIPFSSKVVLFGFFFILVRANVPRYRFDQLLAIS